MEKYSFFDAQQSGNGTFDRTYSSEDLAAYFHSFVGNGVYANPANSLMVQPSKNLTIKVLKGSAWINGYWYELSETDKELTLSRGDNSLPRIDLIVCSLNLSKRLIELKVIQGTAAANPTVPTYQRSQDVYDLVLARIQVPAGMTDVTADLITDTRFDKSLCGVVSGVVNQIDTTDLFKQYDAQFTKWFSETKGSLSGDVAGNLSNKITEIKDANDAAHTMFEQGIAYNSNLITGLDARIKMGTEAAPKSGTPNTIYIQLL